MLYEILRRVKNERPLRLPIGSITTQIGPPLSGKTVRAEAWRSESPDNRRVVDGDVKEAISLIHQGYDVMLNLLPSQRANLPEPERTIT